MISLIIFSIISTVMAENNKDFTKTPQNPAVVSAVSLIASVCCRVFVKMFSALIYISLIIFPWIIEIIIVTQQTEKQQRITTLVVCGSIQTVIAIYGAFKMGKDCTRSCSAANRNEKDDGCSDIWCGCPTDYKSLFTAGYIIYWLPTWLVTNMIACYQIRVVI